MDTPEPETDPRCGTHAGVSEHRRQREPACEACKAFWRGYMRGRRNTVGMAHDRWLNRTRSAALERLAGEYPARFAELVAQVRREEPEPQPVLEAS